MLLKNFQETVTRRLGVLIKVPNLVLPTLEFPYIFAGVGELRYFSLPPLFPDPMLTYHQQLWVQDTVG